MERNELTYAQGAQLLLNRLRRLTVLRDARTLPPLSALERLLEALLSDNPFDAAEEYHALSHALLTGGHPRVSGDLLHDFFLYVLLEWENAFSNLASQQIWDEPLCAAMRMDLTHLDPFFELSSARVKQWIGDAYHDARTKPKTQKDNIAVLSSAVWSGGHTRPLPTNTPPPVSNMPPSQTPSLEEDTFISWRYQMDAPEDGYNADATFEAMRRRLLHTEDRGRLLDDLWHFHASCGTGVFVRQRLFTVQRDGTLRPVKLPLEYDSYSLYQQQREQELQNAIRFMQGDPADNMLLTGDAGTGKTVQIFALARELPALRICHCAPNCMEALVNVIPALLEQPFKFLLFLDDFDATNPCWPQLRATIAPAGIQPENLLVVAAARRGDDSFFPLRIHLNAPQLKEFMELVQLILLQKGKDVDFDSIQNACIDFAASSGRNGSTPLSYRAADIIAAELAED